MKVILIISLLLALGCATPLPVKQAVIKQSEAYAGLQTTLQDFMDGYAALNQQLFRLDYEAQSRLEAVSLIRALLNDDPNPHVEGIDTFAMHNPDLKQLAEQFDTLESSRPELLKAFSRSMMSFEQAYTHADSASKSAHKQTHVALREAQGALVRVLHDIQALQDVHDEVTEYLSIDLSPDAKDLKAAIAGLKALSR